MALAGRQRAALDDELLDRHAVARAVSGRARRVGRLVRARGRRRDLLGRRDGGRARARRPRRARARRRRRRRGRRRHRALLRRCLLAGLLGSALYVAAEPLGAPAVVVARGLQGVWTGGQQAVEGAFSARASRERGGGGGRRFDAAGAQRASAASRSSVSSRGRASARPSRSRRTRGRGSSRARSRSTRTPRPGSSTSRRAR